MSQNNHFTCSSYFIHCSYCSLGTVCVGEICNIMYAVRKHMPRTSTMQQLMNLKMSNSKEGICEECEYTVS